MHLRTGTCACLCGSPTALFSFSNNPSLSGSDFRVEELVKYRVKRVVTIFYVVWMDRYDYTYLYIV